MIHDKALALKVSGRMLKINGALDEAIGFVQAHCSAEEIEDFKQAIGEVMYAVFENALVPIYKEHPELVPEGQRMSGISD